MKQESDIALLPAVKSPQRVAAIFIEPQSHNHMEIKGRVIAKPASESGTSARGFWKRAFLVVRYEDGQFPRDILLSSMRKADEMENVREGQTGTFKFDARTRQAASGR